MTTAIDVIESALEHLGAHSPLNPAPPETLNRAVTVLAGLIEEWDGEEFKLGATEPTKTADELNELPGARNPLEYGLALKLSSVVRKPVTDDLRREAGKSIGIARERFQYVLPDKREGRTLYGQGNRRWR